MANHINDLFDEINWIDKIGLKLSKTITIVQL